MIEPADWAWLQDESTSIATTRRQLPRQCAYIALPPETAHCTRRVARLLPAMAHVKYFLQSHSLHLNKLHVIGCILPSALRRLFSALRSLRAALRILRS